MRAREAGRCCAARCARVSGAGQSSAIPSATKVFSCMLSCAHRRGVRDADQGCVADVCGEARRVPVQVWQHLKTGETRHAWLLDKPHWRQEEYKVLHRYNCFYACSKLHLHHCGVGVCDSLERGHTVETENGDVVCAMSGRVLTTGVSFDWRERKKGAYAARQTRRGGEVMMLMGGAQPAHSNAIDFKLMKTSVNVVFDCLFSKLRQELYMNERRAKKRSLESRVIQHAKRCRREQKFVFVPYLNQVAIEQGYFSNNTYASAVRSQRPAEMLQRLAPRLVAMYQTLNALTPNQPPFKCFPAFAIAALFVMMHGVTLHGEKAIPCLPVLRRLLPHPNAVDGFFRFLWACYAENTSTQRSFLTKTKNTIKAALREMKDKEAVRRYLNAVQDRAALLRDKYYDAVEKDIHFL